MPEQILHHVVLEGTPSGRIVTDVTAMTPQLACRMAERMHLGLKAVEVSLTRRIAGRCDRCRGVIFEGELTRIKHGQLRCESCL